MVSPKFKSTYLQAGLTGILDFESVEIAGAGKKPVAELPTYELIEIPWDGGALDVRATKARWERKSCNYCGNGFLEYHEGILLEEGSWKGHDIFYVRRRPGPIVVSDRFKNIFEGHGLTNAKFVPAERWSYDESWVSSGGKGVHFLLPERRDECAM
jgi:hypothetical protein